MLELLGFLRLACSFMCESDSYTYSVKSSFPWDNVGGWCWPFLQRNRWSVLLRQRAFMSWLDCDSLKEVDRQISLMSDIKLNDIKIHEFFSRFYEWILFVIGFGGLVSKGHLPLWQAWATQTAHMQGIVKTWCALKVPAIFGRSQETTKSTFVLEVEDTHCRHRRWSMIPWFHDVQDFF